LRWEQRKAHRLKPVLLKATSHCATILLRKLTWRSLSFDMKVINLGYVERYPKVCCILTMGLS
jgi:hypothetical protein